MYHWKKKITFHCKSPPHFFPEFAWGGRSIKHFLILETHFLINCLLVLLICECSGWVNATLPRSRFRTPGGVANKEDTDKNLFTVQITIFTFHFKKWEREVLKLCHFLLRFSILGHQSASCALGPWTVIEVQGKKVKAKFKTKRMNTPI